LADRQRYKELEAERARTEEALNKLRQQEVKFADTFAALGAAERLSETIDIKEQTIAQLKNEGKLKFACLLLNVVR
jgi:DNA-binding Xre family transcriptional regulator